MTILELKTFLNELPESVDDFIVAHTKYIEVSGEGLIGKVIVGLNSIMVDEEKKELHCYIETEEEITKILSEFEDEE